jgi:hypothetical protein
MQRHKYPRTSGLRGSQKRSVQQLISCYAKSYQSRDALRLNVRFAPEAVVQETSRVGLDPPRDRAQSRCSSDLCMATRGPWRRSSPP